MPTVQDAQSQNEPEYNPSDFEDDDDELDDFPISHEIVLKDHTKVVSALTLDPSGARILSGSHDYDCKLWDFGGMDSRCKPFLTWEPAGSYHVCIVFTSDHLLSHRIADTRCEIFHGWAEVSRSFWHNSGQIV